MMTPRAIFLRFMVNLAAVVAAFHAGMFVERSNTAFASGQEWISAGLIGLGLIMLAVLMVHLPAMIALVEAGEFDGAKR